MSGTYGSENTPENDDDDVGVNYESTNIQELSSREANSESNNSNEDGVMVNTDNNGSGGDSDGVVVSDDAGREDMFLDAPEDLGADGRDSSATFTEAQGSADDGEEDSGHEHQTRFRGLDSEMQNDYMVDEMERLRALLDRTINEKESIVREYKDEMEMAAKGIANLRVQMKDLVNKQLLLDENNSRSIDHFRGDAEEIPLHEMIHECSMIFRGIMEENLDLIRTSTEVSVSREVVDSYLNSVQNQLAEVQFQKDQYMEDVIDRTLGSFTSIVYVGDLSSNSLTEKIAHVEKSVFTLIENYNWFLYQSDHLRQCLTEVRPDLVEQTDYGLIFAAANDELLGFRKKEADYVEKFVRLEAENSKLMEQVDEHKAIANTASVELEKLKAELEQEKTRYSNTKEKLSLAVTKGKALVQQRDSLKQALTDKTSELDTYLLTLKEKDVIIEKLEDILFHSDIPEGLNSKDITERIKWLVDERNALKDVSLKFHQLADSLLSIDLPENFSFSDLESRLGWLTESFNQAKSEVVILQEEITRIKESFHHEMEHLTASLSMVLVERDYVKLELQDLSEKFEAVVQKEHQASSEKEHILRILLEASGVAIVDSQPSETIVEQCLAMVKERNNLAHESHEVTEEILQTLQILLYVKEQDLVLYDKLWEEEMQKNKTEMDKLFSELRKASEEVATLTLEKENLKNDLERTEEKSSLIREKLSMAVKKGKGLVQEREGMKQLIDEKSGEIEKLKLDLQERELAIIDHKNENSKFQENLIAMKDQLDQLERDLLESNRLLNPMTESMDSIILPMDSSFVEPVEKLRWLAGYFRESQVAKEQSEQELEKTRVEVEMLTKRVSEAHSTIKSLEDALKVAEEKVSQLAEEKRELEHALTLAEVNISRLDKEKEEEITNLSGQLSEATLSVKALEDKISQLETRISLLSDENNEAQISRTNMENELTKLKEESDTWGRKLQDAYVRIKSLEDALSKAENGISQLADEKKAKEQEISTLSAKLNACMEELAGTHGSLESRSLELFDQLKDLELLGKDDSITSLLRKYCETKFESLKEMDCLFRNIRDEFAQLSSESTTSEEPYCLTKLLSTNLDEIVGVESFSSHTDSLDADDISSKVQIMVETFRTKKRNFAEKVDGFLSFLNECNTSVMRELQSIMVTMNSLNQKMKNMETNNQVLENTVTTLEDDVSVLLSACSKATQLLQFEVDKRMPEIKSTPEREEENEPRFHQSKHFKAIEKLLSATRKVCSVCEEFETSRNMLSSTTEELQSNLNKLKVIADSAMEERDLYNDKVRELETEVVALQTSCSELKLKLEKYQDVEINLRDKEAEVSSLQSTLMMKEQEAGEAHFWASHVKSLLERANKIQVSVEDSQVTDLEPQESPHINKLLYIIDNFSESRHQIKSLSYEKEELKTALAAQLRETEHLKEQIRESTSHEQELAKVESKITDMEASLHRIIQKFADRGIIGDQESVASDDLVQVLENLVLTVILESGNLRSKAHELESEIEKGISNEQELIKVKDQLHHLEAGVQKIIQNSRSYITGLQEPIASSDLLQVLENTVMTVILEYENLKSKVHELDSEVGKNISNEQELDEVKGQLFDLEAGLKRIIQKLRGDVTGDQKPKATSDLVQVLENMIMAMSMESENSKSKVHELDLKLFESQKAVDELVLKVKAREDSLQSRAVPPEIVQERSIFEAPSEPSPSEISEIEDVGSVSKPTILPVPSSAHVRMMRKGSADHIAVNIDSESSRLIDKEEAIEDKGHVFKSLNTSGLVPKQGKMIADRIDGIWVSSGRFLMNRPEARLGILVYWLSLHIWLLGTIL